MSIAINNSVQNITASPKETEQPNLVKERAKTEKLQGYDSGIAKDTVEVQNSSRRSIESNQDGHEINNGDEAQKSVEEVIGLINSENGKSSMEEVHNLNPGNLVDLFA